MRCDFLQFFQRNKRFFKKRGSSTRQKKKDGVPLFQSCYHPKDSLRSSKCVLVRDRMTGLIANDIFNRPLYMTVFRKHNACTHLFVKALNGTIRHFPCRFANSNKVKPALGEFAILKCCGHCRAGHNSLNGFAHDALSFIAHSHCSHLFTTWIGALEIKC